MLFDLIFDVVEDLTDIALGPPTPRPPPPSQPRMTAADLTAPRPANPSSPPPRGSDDGPMHVGVCLNSCHTRWLVWVNDGQNRMLWASQVKHQSHEAAQAAGERALADLRRGMVPTEP